MWELIYLTGFAHLQKGNIYISRVVELRVVQRDAMGVPGEKSFEEGVKTPRPRSLSIWTGPSKLTI
jgi:hypothetical protein